MMSSSAASTPSEAAHPARDMRGNLTRCHRVVTRWRRIWSTAFTTAWKAKGCWYMAGRLAVIGAGLMGAGIAQVAAQAGWEVTLRDLDDASVQRGVAGIRRSLERFATKGAIAADEVDNAVARITPTTDLEAAADADIV